MSVETEIKPAAPPRWIEVDAVRPNWGRALRGIWSLTWRTQSALRRLPLIAATVMLVPLLAYSTLDSGQDEAYFHWFIDFYLFLLLPLYCLSIFGALIRDELQSDTLGFYTTRPVTRAQLFLLKYACQIIWVQMLAVAAGLLFLGVGLAREINGVASFGVLFLGIQFLAVLAYGALSALLGLIHQRYMVLGIIYGFVVEMGIGRIPTNINNLSISRHLRTLLGNSETIKGLYDWSPEGAFFSASVMATATILFLIAGAVLFTFREYHHGDEMQK